MKSIRQSLFCLLFLLPLMWAAGTQAQTKLAYIDASKILKRMPEAVDAETRLDQLASGWNREADEMQSELNRKRTDYERRRLVMTDAERSSIELDLQNLQKRLNDFREQKYGTNGELFVQQANLMKPAYDKLLNATHDVAQDLGYDYVFDRSSRDVVMLYTNGKHDLTLQVARKLGVETEILAQPLNNAPKGTPGAPNNQPGQNPAPGQMPGQNPAPGSTVTQPWPPQPNTPVPNPNQPPSKPIR